MTGLDLLAASAIVTAGAALQGAVGFGFALVAAPLLALIDPRLVPGSLLCAALVLTLLTAHRERHAIDTSGIGWGLVGRLPGTALGAAALLRISAGGMELVLGALVLVAVAMSASGLHFRPTPRALVGAGVLSGFMGTMTAIGGPPLAMVYQHAPGAQLRGTLAGYFVIGAAVSLVALALVGRFGRVELAGALSLLPGVLLGFVCSARLAALLDRGYTRGAVLAVSGAAGTLVLVRQLF